MALSAFDDKSSPPRADQLAETLGRASRQWDSLVAALASEYAPLTETWKFSGKQWGWALQLKQKKRAIVYLTPCRGYFIAGFALGEKAVDAAHESGLPRSILAAVDGAQKYMEGRAVRLEVRNTSDVAHVEMLAAVKVAN